MPKFKSPHYIAQQIIKIHERYNNEKPVILEDSILIHLSGREKSVNILKRRLFEKVAEILAEQGFMMLKVPDENAVIVIKKDFAFKHWSYFDEDDLDDLEEFIEEEIEVEEID